MNKKRIIISLIILISMVIFLFIILILVNKSKKTKYIDNIVPIIVAKQKMILLDADTEYNYSDNIEATFGKDGGKILCDEKELMIGENIISCVGKGNNNKISKQVKYIIKVSTTYHKNAIYFGDSITSGWLGTPRGYSWVNYIQDNYDLISSVNAGIADYRVSTYDDKNKWLVTQVKEHYNDNINYDLIIMQGGINDMFYNTPIGTISKSYDVNTFDINTYIGGLETYIATVVNKWPNARIGYIITYFCPNYTERGLKWDYNIHKIYYNATIQVLNKWNIPYLDLFEGSNENDTYSNFLKVYSKDYLPDYLHLNNSGYDKISPYIYSFMQTINKYKIKY